MKKLVIFDLDGTLIDTIDDLARSTNHALAQCGFPEHPRGDYRFFVGNGISKLFERALPEGQKTAGNIARIRGLFMEYYEAHGTDLTRPYPGIPGLLERLQEMGIKLAVASNKYHAATSSLVAHYFPQISFSAVLGHREGIPVKPDPAIVQEILGIAGLGLMDALFVGDSGVDMQTGTNAGIGTVGVTWGFRPRSELERFSPAYIIDEPGELLALL